MPLGLVPVVIYQPVQVGEGVVPLFSLLKPSEGFVKKSCSVLAASLPLHWPLKAIKSARVEGWCGGWAASCHDCCLDWPFHPLGCLRFLVYVEKSAIRLGLWFQLLNRESPFPFSWHDWISEPSFSSSGMWAKMSNHRLPTEVQPGSGTLEHLCCGTQDDFSRGDLDFILPDSWRWAFVCVRCSVDPGCEGNRIRYCSCRAFLQGKKKYYTGQETMLVS